MANESGVVTEEKYDLHTQLDKEMQPTLKDVAQLAYKMEGRAPSQTWLT